MKFGNLKLDDFQNRFIFINRISGFFGGSVKFIVNSPRFHVNLLNAICVFEDARARTHTFGPHLRILDHISKCIRFIHFFFFEI